MPDTTGQGAQSFSALASSFTSNFFSSSLPESTRCLFFQAIRCSALGAVHSSEDLIGRFFAGPATSTGRVVLPGVRRPRSGPNDGTTAFPGERLDVPLPGRTLRKVPALAEAGVLRGITMASFFTQQWASRPSLCPGAPSKKKTIGHK